MKTSSWARVSFLVLSAAVVACTSSGGGSAAVDGGADAGSSGSRDAGGATPDGAMTGSDAGGADAQTAGQDSGNAMPSGSGFAGVQDTSIGAGGVVASTIDERSVLGARAVGKDAYLFTVVLNPPTGLSSQALGVSRFDFDGKLDTGYGDMGTLITAGGSDERFGGAQPFTVDSKGRVYTFSGFFDVTYITKISLFRYDATGKLDTTFGTAGELDISQTDLTGQTGMFAAGSTVYALPDDTLLLAGYIQDAMGDGSNPTRKWFVAKLHADGSLDTKFNAKGYTLIPSGKNDGLGLITVAKDGTIFVGSHRADDAQTTTISKLSAKGVLDTSYGTGGLATIAPNPQIRINRIAADDQGRVVGAGSYPGTGSSSTAAYATRLAADGSVDETFGTSGEVMIDYVTLPYDSSTWLDYFYDVWLDGDQIMLGGFTESTLSGRPKWYVLARLNDDGKLDPDFAYTPLVGHVPDMSYQLGTTGGGIPSKPALLPTPDGKQVVGFGNLAGKISFVRWN